MIIELYYICRQIFGSSEALSCTIHVIVIWGYISTCIIYLLLSGNRILVIAFTFGAKCFPEVHDGHASSNKVTRVNTDVTNVVMHGNLAVVAVIDNLRDDKCNNDGTAQHADGNERFWVAIFFAVGGRV